MSPLGTQLALVALLGFVSACGASKPEEQLYQIHFQALDDRAEPLERVSIHIGETLLGTTDQVGVLKVSVHATEGERHAVSAPCPTGYEVKEAPTEVLFRKRQDLHGERLSRIDLRVVCAHSRRVAALLVHADGHAGMPILIDGVPQGVTGPDGFAHMRLDLPPGAQFEIGLDSSSQPSLLPANPSQVMSIGQEDGLFIFDPVFRPASPVKKRSRVRSRKRRVSVEAPRRPVRID